MHDTESDSAPEERTSAPSPGVPLLRRRENRPVEVDRRRSTPGVFDIAAVLELHLDQCKTRRSMIALLEQWLAEARGREHGDQDRDYAGALERAIVVMKSAPDVQTAIVRLQRQ